MTETGTLRELDVKPGDVVELLSTDTFEGHTYTIQEDDRVLDNDGSGHYYGFVSDDMYDPLEWRIISRASDTPKTWREMTDAEKGALLLAAHEGKVIEELSKVDDTWSKHQGDFPLDHYSYRVKPEPKRETVKLCFRYTNPTSVSAWATSNHTHRITFDTIDGKPDCASIKMDEV